MEPTLKTSVGSTRKAEETRSRILSEALTLFRERGFDQTTMRDIARAANVAIGAAYYYFESKDDILFEVRDSTLVLLEEVVVITGGDDSVEQEPPGVAMVGVEPVPLPRIVAQHWRAHDSASRFLAVPSVDIADVDRPRRARFQ